MNITRKWFDYTIENTINIDYGKLGEALMTMAVDDVEHFRKVTSEDVPLSTIGYKEGVCNQIPLDKNIKFINEFSAETVETKHKELENDEINMKREKDKTWQEKKKRLQNIFKKY